MAALDWWREAGLDQDFLDTAQNWLHRDEPETTSAAPVAPPDKRTIPTPPLAPQVRIGGDSAGWPQNLEAFRAWWLSEPALDDGRVAGRVASRGPADAELMVLVDQPDAEDSGILLSGARGRLLRGILAALGLDPDDVHVASLLPRHTPLPDWPALAEAGMGDLALHQVALAAPSRLIAFGPHVSSLLGHDPANSPLPLAQSFTVGAAIPALAAPGLETLLARPKGKAGLWQALLAWQPS